MSRIEVYSTGKPEGPRTALRPTSIYFYIGLDCSAAAIGNEGPCAEAGGDTFVVVGSDSTPRHSLLVRGSHPQLGGFEMEAGAVSIRESGGSSAEEDAVTVSFMGKSDTPIVDVKQEVEKLHKSHTRVSRRTGKNEAADKGPFVLPNTADVGSNMVLVQVKACPMCCRNFDMVSA